MLTQLLIDISNPARPVIGRVWTTPQLPCDAVSCTLSPPVGAVTFHAQVSGATRVECMRVAVEMMTEML